MGASIWTKEVCIKYYDENIFRIISLKAIQNEKFRGAKIPGNHQRDLLDTGDGKKRESRETRLSAHLAEAKQHNSDTGKLGNRRMKPDNEAALPGLIKEADSHLSTLSAFAVMAW